MNRLYGKFPMNNEPMTIEHAFTRGDRVYLSGPITPNGQTKDLPTNLQAFHQIGIALTKFHGEYLGIVNPACLNQGLDYDELMRRDYLMMPGCSHILMLPGWQFSKGACSELLAASQMGIKPRFLLGDMETVVKQLLDCTAVKATMLETLGSAVTSL